MTRARANAPSRLVLPRSAANRIVSSARSAAPREACGVLVGRVRRGGAEVLRLAAGRNVHPQPRDRFELAPDDFLAAERAARADGLEVVGFWHSHPATGAVPSAVDRGAAWEGYSYLIVSLVGREQLRSWRFAGGEPVEQLIVEPAGAKGLRP